MNVKICSQADFQRITLDDLNKIVASHEDFVEICDLRDCFLKWKAEKTAVSCSQPDLGICAETNTSRAQTPDASVKFSRNLERTQQDFPSYMKKSWLGRMTIIKFKETGLLSSTEKALVVREAAEFILLSVPEFPDEFPRKSEYFFATKQIHLLFAGVFSDKELLGAFLKGDDGKLANQKRGKLPQRIYDIKGNIDSKEAKKKKAKKPSANGSVVHSLDENEEQMEVQDDKTITESDDEAQQEDLIVKQQSLEFVKIHKGPELKIFKEWKNSAPLRKKGQFFLDYPCLMNSFGHKLIRWDFDDQFPGKSEEFKKQFQCVKEKLELQYCSEITDNIGVEMYTVLRTTKKKEIKNYLYLALIPYLLQPVATKRNNMKKHTVNTSANFFICHVKVCF